MRSIAGHRRLALIALVLAASLVAAASASARSAVLRDVRLYQVAKGPDRGDLVITARADVRGQLADVHRHGDAFARLTLRLTDGTSRVVGRDVVALGHAHHLGTPVRFRVVIPAQRARRLDLGTGLTWTAALSRTSGPDARRSLRRFSPMSTICQILAGGLGLPAARIGLCGGAFAPAPPQAPPPPPPAPRVAFSAMSCNGLEECDSWSMCVYFGGPSYANPYVGFLQIADDIPDSNNEAYVSSNGFGPQRYRVAADGSYSFPGTSTWYANGPTAAVTISGTVPASILSAAPDAATGSATVTYAPAQEYVPAPPPAPLDQAILTSISALC